MRGTVWQSADSPRRSSSRFRRCPTTTFYCWSAGEVLQQPQIQPGDVPEPRCLQSKSGRIDGPNTCLHCSGVVRTAMTVMTMTMSSFWFLIVGRVSHIFRETFHVPNICHGLCVYGPRGPMEVRVPAALPQKKLALMSFCQKALCASVRRCSSISFSADEVLLVCVCDHVLCLLCLSG